MCNKEFIRNPSNCEREYDKACNFSEYLDYENCKCRKKLVDKFVDECTETVEEVKLAKITLAENENSYKCPSNTLYIVSMMVVFIICTGIGAYFIYYNWSLFIKFGARSQTDICQTYKLEMLNKLTVKTELIIFTTIKLT